MSHYWRYRKSSGEIKGVSEGENIYVDDSYFGVLTDPSTPDGMSFDPQKIWDGSVVRNATAPEIAGFAAAEMTDDNLMQRDDAIYWMRDHPVIRKALKSAFEVVLEEFNVLRPLHSLSDRTLSQFLTAWESKVNGGDND